jgi:hypothetical protein
VSWCLGLKTDDLDLDNIRTTILHSSLIPNLSDLLSIDNISARMLDGLLWSLGQFMQFGLFGLYYTMVPLTACGIDDLRDSILRTNAIYALARLRSSERLSEDCNALLSNVIADGRLIAFTYAFM